MNNENGQPSFPYVSYPTFKTFIAHLHSTVVTDQIDSSMMPPTMSGGARSAVVSALKSLGLVDERNNTSPKLRELVQAFGGNAWPAAIKKFVLSAYTGLGDNFDLRSATRKQLEGVFEDATPQMKDKYIRFFLSANKDASIAYSPHLKIRRRLPKKRGETLPPRRNARSNDDQVQARGAKSETGVTPADMFDQPIPIQGTTGICFIRVPRGIKTSQVELVKAAVAFIEAMAKQNEANE